MAQHYPPEFRAEAVRLVRDDGLTITEVAQDLGCARQSVMNWVEQAEIDAGKRDGLSTTLRRRVRVLEQEREILKKPQPGSPRRPTRPHRVLRVHAG